MKTSATIPLNAILHKLDKAKNVPFVPLINKKKIKSVSTYSRDINRRPTFVEHPRLINMDDANPVVKFVSHLR